MGIPVGNHSRGEMPGPVIGPMLVMRNQTFTALSGGGNTAYKFYFPFNFKVSDIIVAAASSATDITVDAGWSLRSSDDWDADLIAKGDNIIITAIDWDANDTGSVLKVSSDATNDSRVDAAFDSSANLFITQDSTLEVRITTAAGAITTSEAIVIGHAYGYPHDLKAND